MKHINIKYLAIVLLLIQGCTPEKNNFFPSDINLKWTYSINIYSSYKNGDLNEAAFNLFNFLRKLDKLKKKKISIYPIPKKGIGKVINERLNRAKVNE